MSKEAHTHRNRYAPKSCTPHNKCTLRQAADNGKLRVVKYKPTEAKA